MSAVSIYQRSGTVEAAMEEGLEPHIGIRPIRAIVIDYSGVNRNEPLAFVGDLIPTPIHGHPWDYGVENALLYDPDNFTRIVLAQTLFGGAESLRDRVREKDLEEMREHVGNEYLPLMDNGETESEEGLRLGHLLLAIESLSNDLFLNQ